MKTLTVTLRSVSHLFSHEGLIGAVREFTRWDNRVTSDFIRNNDDIHFNKLTPDKVKKLFSLLERGGFSLDVRDTKAGFDLRLSADRDDEITQIRAQLNLLSRRLDALESKRSGENLSFSGKSAGLDERVDRRFDRKDLSESLDSPMKSGSPGGAKEGAAKQSGMRESDIGRYWLSRIGVFTLLLGVVFLITYTSSYLGKWGKLLIGGCAGVLLTCLGNYLVTLKKYAKWAMPALGGGWAIIFFSVYAAHHVETVRVINSPLLGLFFLVVVAFFSIGQSLYYRSPTLIMMSYFLAFIAIITTHVTTYTLIVSFLLALSTTLTIRRLERDWYLLIGVVILYGVHWVWLDPQISFGASGPDGYETFFQAVLYPFVGDTWSIYPLIDKQKSLLHLGFLFLYWLLFCGIDLVQGRSGRESERIMPFLFVGNTLIFTVSVLHHLHIYYPQHKFIFMSCMSALFFVNYYRELRLNSKIWPDVSLAICVALAGLILPMYFDGSSVTYGWISASLVLFWIGMRYQKGGLRAIAGFFAVLVLGRLFLFDFKEAEPLFKIVSLNGFFFICIYVSLLTVCAAYLYRSCRIKGLIERQYAYDVLAVIGGCVFFLGVLMGGPRELASFVGAGVGGLLFMRGLLLNRIIIRFAGCFFILVSVLRYLSIDFNVPYADLHINNVASLRYFGAIIALIVVFGIAEKLRPIKFDLEIENKYFVGLVAAVGFLYLFIVIDEMTEFYRSILWGAGSFGILIFGFLKKEKVYRWAGLIGFAFVLSRLFLFDFAKLDMLPRILSFMGLGIVLIVASLIYTRFTKELTSD